MAAAGQRLISVQEEELLSFLKQNIIRKICEVIAQLGLPHTHPVVCQTVSKHFNLGPALHQLFDNLVWQLAQTI